MGIDEYGPDSLRGCVSDAERVADVLGKHHDGSPNFECRSLFGPRGMGVTEVTSRILREALEDLFRDPAEIALLHFSGHGTVNNLDGYLVTQDAARYSEGVAMGDVLTLANSSRVSEVVILLDCCHSGSLGNIPAVDNTKAMLKEGISILTASRADQVSVESAGGGLFTSLLVDALAGGAANLLGEVSAPAIYSYVEAALGAWDQRPLFKSHVSRVLPLRRCSAAIELAVLRRLPEIFPLPAEDLDLDPSYEPNSTVPNPVHTAKFRDLQHLARVYLVIPVDAPHMYDAAMASKSCRLTPSGRYYWRLAKDGLI